MIVFIAQENAQFDKALASWQRAHPYLWKTASDHSNLQRLRTVRVLGADMQASADKLSGMPTVVNRVERDQNLVFVKGPQGWFNVTDATAAELASVIIGAAAQTTHVVINHVVQETVVVVEERPTARQIFNPTGSLLGDLALAALAGVGQAFVGSEKDSAHNGANSFRSIR